MNAAQITKQVKKATIEAEGSRRLFSEVADKTVRNGQGVMSQRYCAEMIEKRAAGY